MNCENILVWGAGKSVTKLLICQLLHFFGVDFPVEFLCANETGNKYEKRECQNITVAPNHVLPSQYWKTHFSGNITTSRTFVTPEIVVAAFVDAA